MSAADDFENSFSIGEIFGNIFVSMFLMENNILYGFRNFWHYLIGLEKKGRFSALNYMVV